MSGDALTTNTPTKPPTPFSRFRGRLGPILGLIVIWLIFAILNGNDFIRWDNQRLMLLQTAVVGTAALGSAIIIFSGGIDLSVGSSIALSSVIVAILLKADYSAGVAVLGAIGTGLLCGLLIGATVVGHIGIVASIAIAFSTIFWLRTQLGWPLAISIGIAMSIVLWLLNRRFIKRLPLTPFIVTLGMLAGLRGAAKGVANSQAVYPEKETWISSLMTVSDSGLGMLLSPSAWILLALAVVMAVLLNFTRFGRHVYAVGSNEATARLCGLHVDRIKMIVYVLGIGCAGVAGVLQFSFLSMGDPTTAGGYELKAIASVVIGGASLAGGEGGIVGTLVGALIMTIVDNGCTKLGLDNWVQEVVTGAIIVTAVALDRFRHRRSA